MKPKIPRITPAEMIAWFEGKSSEFLKIAETLRETFTAEGKPAITLESTGGQGQARHNGAPPSFESIKTFLNDKESARYSEIATGTSGTADDVRAVIKKHPETFEMYGRGWIKLKKT